MQEAIRIASGGASDDRAHPSDTGPRRALLHAIHPLLIAGTMTGR